MYNYFHNIEENEVAYDQEKQGDGYYPNGGLLIRALITSI